MQVIWKATEKDQNKRYQTALDFKVAIKQAMLPPLSTSVKVQDWVDSHIGICIGGITALIVFIGLLIFIL